MNRTLAAFSAGTRVAGAVIAAGYLTGLVPGTVVAAVGGLALMTLGRAVAIGPPDDARIGLALAVIASAMGVAALRWETLDLNSIRGVQAVLGPTVLVGPTEAATAAWMATGAAVVALGLWAGRPPAPGGRALWLVEVAIGALAIVGAFWGPAVVGGGDLAVDLAGWVAAVAVAGATAAGVALLDGMIGRRLGWVLALVCAAAVAAGAGLTVGVS